jgi:UDP-N-acetylmuramoyl-L-alanyl-D-glutamate--2,6-diaminopimelate ligase
VKKLKELLTRLKNHEIKGNPDIEISDVCFDSRLASSNSLFVAVKGTRVDGHEYIDETIEKGCEAVICQSWPDRINESVTYIKVVDSAHALGVAASWFHGDPSTSLQLVGITGTNGKTTTATLLYRLAQGMGHKAGLLSTVANYIGDKEISSTHTTPDPLQINRLLASMVEEGCRCCFMEVSSHAVDQKRIAGLQFAGGVFTNLTHDHLDYHGSFDHYLKAKKRFFDELPPGAFVLVNVDDKNGRVMVQNTRARVHSYALKTMADFRAKIIQADFDGMMLQIQGVEVWTRFIGQFNAYNLLAVFGTACLLEWAEDEVLQYTSAMEPVSGRFEYLRSASGKTAIVDYAHTPDALQNVITTINQIRGNQVSLITVVGAGGDRDKSKRPVMASVATRLSDKVILTADNPRSEDPLQILKEMQEGIPSGLERKVLVIPDRKEAIRTACMLANEQDIILVAGKGHENYQEIHGVKHHFDDKEVIREMFYQP